ncbi:hydroxyacid dehydrogenase [Jiella pacifica]|uniref:Hydroxyacid dehydrogenase n=1 Tax=Jiella pacifica TaxID=2696469 RepID=A0A6N9T7L8_9HYPH|nr:hydroxyacid dehydrogenase [Jiella pacifica]NDW07373.1 hydroxyacid dehydrogenase [Jiella pacifica]
MTRRFKIVSTDPLHPQAEATLREAHDYRSGGDGTSLHDLVADADALIVRRKLPDDIFDHAPKLLACVRHGVGLDFVPVEAATSRGIPVANLLDANKQSVVEYVVATALMLARGLAGIDRALKSEGWNARNGYDGGFELFGKTLGVVGCGRIGRGVADAMQAAFAMTVVGHAARPFEHDFVVSISLEDLFARADIVTLHLPSTPQTRGLIGSALFERMKPGAILINAARGDVVDDRALLAGLEAGRPSAAAIDVFEPEPAPRDHPLLRYDRVFATPHIAGLSRESAIRMSTQAVTETLKVLHGEKPTSLINPAVWETHIARLNGA